jgi:Fe2+ transport system protein FeoA
MSLEKLENGKRGVVLKIDGSLGAKDHLLQLGIVPGVPVTMVQRATTGPILVEVLGTKVMLGHGLAEKVLVA